MKTTHIIWDFNGTILNDLPLSLKSINTVLKKRNLPLLNSEEDYRKVFHFPIISYYEKLGMDFSKEPYKIPADEWIALYNSGIKEIPLTDCIIETLEAIKNLKIPQLVLSASEKSMLLLQLEHYNLTKYFDQILGTDSVYGGGKIEMAKKWAIETDTCLTNAVFIGDTDHDYETAKALGCKCILYSGGHMSKTKLEKLGVPVIDCIKDILKYV